MPRSRQLLPTLAVFGALLVVMGVVVALSLRGSGPPADDPGARTPTPTPSPSGSPAPSVPGPGSPAPSLTLPTAVPTQPCRPQQLATRLTVASFNIHSARTGAGVRLDLVADEIAALNADVVLLQEVDRGRAVTGRVDMPTVLADRLGMEQVFGANVRSGSEEYGTALLSRYPVVSWRNHPLPNSAGGQPRGVLHAVLDVDGLALSVYNTHLDFRRGGLKAVQARAVADLVADDPRPRVLGGDLNAKPGSAVVAAVTAVATDPWPQVGVGTPATSPADAPVGRIDYLLHAGPGLTPLWADTVPTGVSDHRPVRTRYRLTGLGGCEPVS